MSELTLQDITVGQLQDLVADTRKHPDKYPVLPISGIRAQSQVSNPVADPEDLAMVLAFLDGKCRGYLGTIPCTFRRDGKDHVVYALSTFYVDAALRGTGAAGKIMGRMISQRRDLLLAGYTESAEAFYRKNDQWFTFAGELSCLRIGISRFTKMFSSISRRVNQRLLRTVLVAMARTANRVVTAPRLRKLRSLVRSESEQTLRFT